MFHFNHPCTLMIAGPTGCGKTQFISSVIHNKLFDPMPNGKLIWIYGEYQTNIYDSHKAGGFEFIKDGADDPSLIERFSSNESNLLIIDDQMESVLKSKVVSRLFTQGSHHRNLSVVLLMQNLYAQGDQMRNISLNTQYNIVFKNPRDRLQIRKLGEQMFPKYTKFLVDAFEDATNSPYGYLIISNHPKTEQDNLRVCTNIFDESPIYYVPSGSVTI